MPSRHAPPPLLCLQGVGREHHSDDRRLRLILICAIRLYQPSTSKCTPWCERHFALVPCPTCSSASICLAVQCKGGWRSGQEETGPGCLWEPYSAKPRNFATHKDRPALILSQNPSGILALHGRIGKLPQLWPIVAIALQLSFHPAGDSGYLCNRSWAGPGVCDATCGRCTYCPVFEDPYCQVNIQVIDPSQHTLAGQCWRWYLQIPSARCDCHAIVLRQSAMPAHACKVDVSIRTQDAPN